MIPEPVLEGWAQLYQLDQAKWIVKIGKALSQTGFTNGTTGMESKDANTSFYISAQHHPIDKAPSYIVYVHIV